MLDSKFWAKKFIILDFWLRCELLFNICVGTKSLAQNRKLVSNIYLNKTTLDDRIKILITYYLGIFFSIFSVFSAYQNFINGWELNSTNLFFCTNEKKNFWSSFFLCVNSNFSQGGTNFFSKIFFRHLFWFPLHIKVKKFLWKLFFWKLFPRFTPTFYHISFLRFLLPHIFGSIF